MAKKNTDRQFTPLEARLRAILAAKGMTITALAANMGKAPESIQSFFKRDCSLSTLYEIAKGLDVQVSDLFDVPEGYVRFDTTTMAPHTPQGSSEGQSYTPSAQHQTLFCPHCGQKFVMLPRED